MEALVRLGLLALVMLAPIALGRRSSARLTAALFLGAAVVWLVLVSTPAMVLR